MPIKLLPEHLRPQEKALRYGIDKLSEIELMSLVLRSGSPNSDAMQLSSTLLQKFGSFKNVLQASIESMTSIRGIGKVKALQLAAISKLLKTSQDSPLVLEDALRSLSSKIDYVFKHFNNFQIESFFVVLLTKQDQVIYIEQMYVGTAKEVSFSPKEVVALALAKKATKFFCAHNHPSNNVTPSLSDINLTKQLKNLAQLLDVTFLEHIVINSQKDYQLISW